MTKASDPKARPEVAKKGANKASDIYDFVQSPEWQEVLEKARKQQEVKDTADKANAGARQAGVTTSGNETNSTSGVQSQTGTKAAAGKIDPDTKPAATTNSAGAGESAGKPATAGNNKPQAPRDNRSAEKHAAAEQQSEPTQSTDPKAQPGAKSTAATDPDDLENALANPEPSLKLSEDEVADRLRKNLLERMEGQKRSRRKARLGLVAAGCAMGVAASSSVFLVLAGWNSPGPSESAGAVVEETEVANLTSRAGDAETTLSGDQSGGSDEQLALSATVFDTPVDLTTSVGEKGETEALASAALPGSDTAGQSGGVEPKTLRLAPNVRSFVPSLTQPPLPITLLSYRPRSEINLGFVRGQSSPEIFSTSVAMLEVAVSGAIPEEFLAGATDVPNRVALARTLAEETEVAISSAPEEDSLPASGPERAYLPEMIAPSVGMPGPKLVPPQVVASFGMREYPGPGVSITPIETGLRVASLSPTIQPEDIPLAPEATYPPRAVLPPAIVSVLPDVSKPPVPTSTLEAPAIDAEPTLSVVPVPAKRMVPLAEDAPAPTETVARTASLEITVAPADPAPSVTAFRIYAPSNVPQGVVDSIVANLTTTGHELSAQARVGFGISQSNVRYYHPQDAEQAAALARDAGALLRDFTGASTKTPSGIIELWVAGDGSGAAPVKRTATRRTARSQPTNQVNRLRSQVLSKLKRATNQ